MSWYPTLVKTIIVAVSAVYLLGFAGTFWLHTQMPVTFGLALLRSAAWPAWVMTGWPHGSPLRMD